MIKISINTKSLLLVMLLVVCAVPWVIFFKSKAFSGYFLAVYLIAPVKHYLYNYGYIPHLLNRTNIPGNWLLVAIMNQILGVSMEKLQSWPIAAILTGVALLVFYKKVSKSWIISILVVTGIVYSSSIISPGDWSIYVHGWGMIFYIVFLLILLRMSQWLPSIVGYLLLLLIFVGNHFFDYTAEMWMIVTFIVFILFSETKEKSIKKKKWIGIGFLLFASIAFYFRKILHENLLRFSLSTIPKSVFNFFSIFFPIFKSSTLHEFRYINPIPFTVKITNVAFYLTLLILIGLSMRKYFIEWIAKKMHPSHLPPIVIALLVTMLVELFIYSAYGLIRINFLIYFSPAICLFGLFYLLSTPLKTKIIVIIFGGLLLINIVNFDLRIDYGLFPQLSSTQTNQSVAWLFRHTKDDFFLLSDLVTLGKYKLWESMKDARGKNLTMIFYNLTLYKYVIGIEKRSTAIDFVAIDIKTSRGVDSVGWVTFEPLKKHKERINNNLRLYKLYDDGNINIYSSSTTL